MGQAIEPPAGIAPISPQDGAPLSDNTVVGLFRSWDATYRRMLYRIRISDSDGVGHLYVTRRDGSPIFTARPQCGTAAYSEAMAFEDIDFPLRAYVVDCAGASMYGAKIGGVARYVDLNGIERLGAVIFGILRLFAF
jgi:hypothetical protein